MKKQGVKQAFLLSDIIILLAIFAVSVALFFAGPGWKGVGILLIFCVLIFIPFFRHGYRLEGQSGFFKMKEVPVSREDKEAVLAYLDGKDAKPAMKAPVQNGGALVEIYYRQGEAFARYFDYVEFNAGKEYPLVKIPQEKFDWLESCLAKK